MLQTAFVSDLTRFPLQAMFLTKNSWQTVVRDARELLYVRKSAEHVIYTYVITKNMQLRASTCIPLYVQHFQVQGEREQTIEQVASLYNSRATIQLQYHKHKISTTASLATPCPLATNIQVFNVSFKLLNTPHTSVCVVTFLPTCI